MTIKIERALKGWRCFVATEEIGDYLEFIPEVSTNYGVHESRRSRNKLLAGNTYIYNGGVDESDRTFDIALKIDKGDIETLRDIYKADSRSIIALPFGSYRGRIGSIESDQWPVKIEFWPSEVLREET